MPFIRILAADATASLVCLPLLWLCLRAIGRDESPLFIIQPLALTALAVGGFSSLALALPFTSAIIGLAAGVAASYHILKHF